MRAKTKLQADEFSAPLVKMPETASPPRHIHMFFRPFGEPHWGRAMSVPARVPVQTSLPLTK